MKSLRLIAISSLIVLFGMSFKNQSNILTIFDEEDNVTYSIFKDEFESKVSSGQSEFTLKNANLNESSVLQYCPGEGVRCRLRVVADDGTTVILNYSKGKGRKSIEY